MIYDRYLRFFFFFFSPSLFIYIYIFKENSLLRIKKVIKSYEYYELLKIIYIIIILWFCSLKENIIKMFIIMYCIFYI